VSDPNHFVALSECHFMNPGTLAEVAYYPGNQRWWDSVDGVMRAWSGRDLTGEWPHPIAEELIKYMDEAGVDVCFALREGMMDISGGTVSFSTNQFMINQIAPYPDRMYLECMVGPILRRGMEHALWELEYMVKECNAKLCKVYQPEDDGPLDDRRMWPFYEKAQELDITLTIHTGMSYVVPQPSFHTHPNTLARVLLDFPDLRVTAYHMAWPDGPEQDRDGARPALRRHQARRRLGAESPDPRRAARAVWVYGDHRRNPGRYPRHQSGSPRKDRADQAGLNFDA